MFMIVDDRTVIGILGTAVATFAYVIGIMTQKNVNNVDRNLFGFPLPEKYCRFQIYFCMWAISVITGKYVMIFAAKAFNIINH